MHPRKDWLRGTVGDVKTKLRGHGRRDANGVLSTLALCRSPGVGNELQVWDNTLKVGGEDGGRSRKS